MTTPPPAMSELYQFLMEHVFDGFLRQDSALLNAVATFEGDLQISANHFIFTLPALFQLTCSLFEQKHQQVLAKNRSDYLQFRKQLYNNPTNTLLRERGGVVEVEKPDKDHDRSTYRLVHIAESASPYEQ
ncbi:hypothetical protein [Alkalimarinus coralli]|uniref:hypothetical protein n=1 Tax=Alkalimarinus coralli TaxID=2935863 RepID=UPI00202B1FC3|nr:hypothetical protein [Alkalimarinus coralli]